MVSARYFSVEILVEEHRGIKIITGNEDIIIVDDTLSAIHETKKALEVEALKKNFPLFTKMYQSSKKKKKSIKPRVKVFGIDYFRGSNGN